MDRLQKQRPVAVGGEVINEGIGGDRYIGLGRSRWPPQRERRFLRFLPQR